MLRLSWVLILSFWLMACSSSDESSRNNSTTDVADSQTVSDVALQQDTAVIDLFNEPNDTSQVDLGQPHDISADAAIDVAVANDAVVTPDVAPKPKKVTFIAIGDIGTGSSAQKQVAAAIKTYCDTNGCDFVVALGDLIYSDGVKSVNDSQFQTKFETPYKDLDLKFYMSLGNHDYGTTTEKRDAGFGNVQAMIDYTEKSEKWFLPALYYSFSKKHVGLFALNTERMTSTQVTKLGQKIRESNSTWKIGFGHRPLRSNGKHGDTTGSRGDAMRRMMCGRVDLYLAGHDHHLEHLHNHCGIQLIVSGAGGTRRTFGVNWDDKPRNLDDSIVGFGNVYGFTVVTIVDDTIRFKFIDRDSKVLYESPLYTKPKLECGQDDVCDERCDSDPDCSGLDCSDDGECNRKCAQDPDCYEGKGCPCDFNYQICEPSTEDSALKCGCDQDCWPQGKAPCQADDHCDIWCPKTGEDADPDCAK